MRLDVCVAAVHVQQLEPRPLLHVFNAPGYSLASIARHVYAVVVGVAMGIWICLSL